MFLAVQIISYVTIGLIIGLIFFLVSPFFLPQEFRISMFQLFVDNGILGPNAVWLIYGIISLVIAQQIIKVVAGVPLSTEVEPADIDHLFPAPIQAQSYYTAKYIRSIIRRLNFYLYALLVLSPLFLFVLSEELNWTPLAFIFFFLVVFFLGEIGSIATHGLYCVRRLSTQPRSHRRLIHFIFNLGFVIGIFFVLTPPIPIGSLWYVPPIYGLAIFLVALFSQGKYASLPLPPASILFLMLLLGYLITLVIVRFLTNKVALDLYEDIAKITQQQGLALGLLTQLPLRFTSAKSSLRAVLQKDFIMGLRKPGKAIFWFGAITNFAFAFFLLFLVPNFQFVVPLPPELAFFLPTLYSLLLVLLIPLLTVSAADPFQGEYRNLYLLRLAPLHPIGVTLEKFALLLVTPFMLTVPFAIYFAVILTDLSLLVIAVPIIPHAILLSASMGIALGSRYPYVSRTRTYTSIALMVAFPMLSWLVIIPVVIFQLIFLQSGITWMLMSSIMVIPYTLGVLLLLLLWAARSYRLHEP